MLRKLRIQEDCPRSHGWMSRRPKLWLQSCHQLCPFRVSYWWKKSWLCRQQWGGVKPPRHKALGSCGPVSSWSARGRLKGQSLCIGCWLPAGRGPTLLALPSLHALLGIRVLKYWQWIQFFSKHCAHCSGSNKHHPTQHSSCDQWIKATLLGEWGFFWWCLHLKRVLLEQFSF